MLYKLHSMNLKTNKLTFNNILYSLKASICFAVNSKADTAVINSWISKSNKLLFKQPDSASLFLDSISKESQDIDYHYGLFITHNSHAIIKYMEGHNNEAIKEYLRALPYASEPFQEIRLYTNITYALRNLGLQDSAIFYTEKSIRLSNEYGLKDIYQQFSIRFWLIHI